jgi:hypothetical protein
MPERASPLLILTEKLYSQGVPSLRSLVAQIAGAEEYAEFINLIKRFLPERERDILQKRTPGAQIASFASYFEDRYFPLHDYFESQEVESYGELVSQIPVTCLGISWEDLHEATEWQPYAMLMTYLVESPWPGEDIDVSLAEACSEHLPEALIQRAGKIRLSPEKAHKLLDGTRYEPLALWAERICQSTGNLFLDTDYETLSNSPLPDWTPEEVEGLTREWQSAEALIHRTDEFMTWLEEDLGAHAEELISFIEGREVNGPKEPR